MNGKPFNTPPLKWTAKHEPDGVKSGGKANRLNLGKNQFPVSFPAPPLRLPRYQYFGHPNYMTPLVGFLDTNHVTNRKTETFGIDEHSDKEHAKMETGNYVRGKTTEEILPNAVGETSLERVEEMTEESKHFAAAGRRVFTCSQCRYTTDRKNNLKRHVGTMHKEASKILECCDIIFRSKASLREHVRMYHRHGYECRFCSRTFCRKALLKRHLTVHNGRKDFVCSVCDYATSHKSNLERHRKVHCRKWSSDDEPIKEHIRKCPTDIVPNRIIAQSQFKQLSPAENRELVPTKVETKEQSQSTQKAALIGDNFVNIECNKRNIKSRSMFPLRLKYTHSIADIIAKPDNVRNVKSINSNEIVSENETDPLHADRREAATPVVGVNSAMDTDILVVDKEDEDTGRHVPRRMYAVPYECSDCGKVFFTQLSLEEHTKTCVATPGGRPLRQPLESCATICCDKQKHIADAGRSRPLHKHTIVDLTK